MHLHNPNFLINNHIKKKYDIYYLITVILLLSNQIDLTCYEILDDDP